MLPLLPEQVVGLVNVVLVKVGVAFTVTVKNEVSASQGPAPSGSFEINRITFTPATAEVKTREAVSNKKVSINFETNNVLIF